MRVCFVAGTLGCGGAERQLLFMLKALQREGIAARVLSLTMGEEYERRIEDIGIRVEFVGASRNQLRRLWAMVDNLRKDPVDIIQGAHFFTNIYAALAGRALRIPSVGAVRGDLTRAIAANGKFGNGQLRWPNHLIANSRSAVNEAIELGINESKIVFVKNIVERDEGTSRKRASGQRGLNILFAGRLVPLKRPERFLQLAARLRAYLPDHELRFQIAGDGPLRTRAEEFAREIGLLANGVEFLGEVSTIERVYQTTDILVLTSEHEGTPNVILEAMAHGIPVVATRVGGVPDILPEQFGFTVDPDDFEELVECTERLIRDPDLRHQMAVRGMEYVCRNHSMAYLQKKLKEVYSTIIARSL